ncbi:ROK family transcriptional regulator [Bifidobacterium sp.]|uniref:ROK family transcriptional regulator n=1 Tax=Bifidobacterium sp. TaxID=41200 RepID=UPI0039EC8753
MSTSKTSRILHRLIAMGPATRGQLGTELGMSSATITRLLTPLIRLGVVQILEGFNEDYTIGKPAYSLAIVSSFTAFVGVKVTDDAAFAVLVDLNGTILRKSHVRLPNDAEDVVVDILARQIRDVSMQCAIAGVGIGVGGKVMDGHVVASGILRWNAVDLGGRLQEALDVPVTVSNDVNAFAQAAAWWGAGRGADSFVLISIGSGIGACIVQGGSVMPGEHGSAGMIGHLPITKDGPICESGHVGCARAYASSTCILRNLRERYGIDEGYDDFIDRAKRGLEPESGIADSAVDAVAHLVSAAIAFIDPDAIVVSGDGVRLLEVFEDEFRGQVKAYRHWNGAPVEVKLQEMQFTFWAEGAAAASMERWTQSKIDGKNVTYAAG